MKAAFHKLLKGSKCRNYCYEDWNELENCTVSLMKQGICKGKFHSENQ